MVKTLTYDGRQDKCPLPLVKTKLLLKQLKIGEQLVLKLTDAGSIQDIPKLLTKLEVPFVLKQHQTYTCLTIIKKSF